MQDAGARADRRALLAEVAAGSACTAVLFYLLRDALLAPVTRTFGHDLIFWYPLWQFYAEGLSLGELRLWKHSPTEASRFIPPCRSSVPSIRSPCWSPRSAICSRPICSPATTGRSSGPAFSRNRGIEASSGEILVFVDADCEVDDPEWLARHVRLQAARPGAIVGGGIVGVGQGIIARADSYCHWFTNIPHAKKRAVSQATRRRRIRFFRHLVTTNMSVTRQIWLAVGPFEEWLRTGEDVEFCERAVSRGFTLWLQPDIIVRHHDRERLGDFFRCFYRAGRDRVPARRLHRSQYHALMPRGVLSSILLCVPIGLIAPIQPVRAWFPSDKRVVLYYPLIALASFAMALGIVRYWIEQRKTA